MRAALLSTREAAEQLGVTDRRIRALVRSGELQALRIGRELLVLPESIEHRRASGAVPGRPLSVRMSWAALSTDLCANDVDTVAAALRLSATERRRLTSVAIRPATEWMWLARRRSVVRRVSVAPATLATLLRSTPVVLSGRSGLEYYASDSSSGDVVTAEVYADASLVGELTRDGLCSDDAGGNLIVHEIPPLIAAAGLLARRRVTTMTMTAVDLLESAEPQVRRAGLRLFEASLRRH